jgi:hypothetical protein
LTSVKPLAIQLGIAAAGLVTLTAAPPVEGKMLLVPLTPAAARALPHHALSSGATIVEIGPIANSLVVRGQRSAIFERMLVNGVLVLSAAPSGCGAARTFK